MPRLSAPPDKFSQDWLTSLDGRTTIAQVMSERWQAFTDDLGGADRLSYAHRSLCSRALWLEYWLTSQEQQLAEGKEFDVARWTQAANALQGILAKLGLERQAKTTVDLQSYLQAKAAKP